MRVILIFAALTLSLSAGAAPQSAAENIALGDRAYAAMDASGALAFYERAAAADPQSYEGLWKAARTAIDVGAASGTQPGTRRSLYERGELHARRAVALQPGDPEGHFVLAYALGRAALSRGARARVRMATEIRQHALQCLELRPAHAGCLHVLGMWNAEAMRLNPLARAFARALLGGSVLGTASWRDAVRYLEAAVAAEPDRIVHRADLADVYLDLAEKEQARAELRAILDLPLRDYSDSERKTAARAKLGRLGSG